MENSESGIVIRLKSPFGWVNLEIKAEPANLQLATSLVRAEEGLWGDLANHPSPTRGWFSPTYAHKIPALSLAVEVQSTESIKFSSEFIFPKANDER
jgi:hypothetical protein